MLDVIIVGGGPAGLSAALVLARCRRKILVFDDGHPRNAASHASHNVFTRDGVPPRELLRLAAEDLKPYNVQVIASRVTQARCICPGDPLPEHEAERPDATPRQAAQDAPPHDRCRTAFAVTLVNGQTYRSRKLLIATGVKDELPDVPGAADFYGKGVHHCPYCDGYEYADQPLVAFGEGRAAVGLALSLRTWSKDVTACTNGTPIDDACRDRVTRNGIKLREEPIARLEGRRRLERICFGASANESKIESGAAPSIPCAALFFNTGQYQHSQLPHMLGCELKENGQVVTKSKQHTCVSGLYLAGDADGDTQFVIVAAAEGATAATAINRDLQDEDTGDAEPVEDAWRFAPSA